MSDMKEETFEDKIVRMARTLATQAHAGQFRRDGVTPYIRHPENVARMAKRYGWKFEVVSLLHDVLEDTKVTAKDLESRGFSEEIITAIIILTKTGKVSYEEYLHKVKWNVLARTVKILDMISNLADSPTDKQLRKYAKGLEFLTDLSK